jgi:hypothetical protein
MSSKTKTKINYVNSSSVSKETHYDLFKLLKRMGISTSHSNKITEYCLNTSITPIVKSKQNIIFLGDLKVTPYHFNDKRYVPSQFNINTLFEFN